jgi:hypothetical protein
MAPCERCESLWLIALALVRANVVNNSLRESNSERAEDRCRKSASLRPTRHRGEVLSRRVRPANNSLNELWGRIGIGRICKKTLCPLESARLVKN